MIFRKTLFAAFALAFPAMAAAKDAYGSDWVDFREARVRLLVSKPETGATRITGGLEILLEPGFKTYWRNAGDSGVPPSFDFSRSDGIGPAEVAFPFPDLFDDGAGGKAIGYKTSVILPFFAPLTTPVPKIALKLDFAVCGTMCIPLAGEFALDMARARMIEPEGAEKLARNLAQVPRAATSGEHARKVERLAIEPARFAITLPWNGPEQGFAAFPEATSFAEILSCDPAPDGMKVIVALDKPPAGAGFGTLRLTYGTRENALEQSIDLDAAKVTP